MLFFCITLLPVIYLFVSGLLEGGNLLFLESRHLNLLLNTIKIGIGTAFLSTIIGVFLAIIIQKTDICFKNILNWLYISPILIPPYIYALTLTGILPNCVLFRGVIGTIIILTLSYFPFVTLIAICGLNSIDNRLEEAGMITHSELGILVRITIPLLMPYILAGSLLVFVFAISDYGVPSLLQVSVYTVEIFVKFSAFYEHAKAVIMSIPLMLIAFSLVLLQKHYMKNRSYVTITTEYKKAFLFQLGKWRVLLSAAIIISIAIVVLVPIITLIIQSWGWNSYKIAIKTSYKEIGTSVLLAVLGASICVLISFFISYIIEKTKLGINNAVDILSVMPFAIPPTVIGIGLIKIWNTPYTNFIYGSPIILILAYITVTSPFVIRILCSNLKQIGGNLEEAAMILGVGWFKRTVKIIVPLMSDGLKSAWAIAFILCMRELGSTLLIIPPGRETLPIKIYNLMHYGASKLVASLSIILLCLTILPILLLRYVKIRKYN